MDNKEYRQVVSDMSITSSKEYNDFLYGWLVLNANMEDQVYIWKRDFVLSKMEQELGMTRKTIAKYFSFLVKEGLVVEEEDRYVIAPLGERGFWVDEGVLRRLIETKKRYAASIYVYLKKGRWLISGRSVPILLGNLKRYIGITNNSNGNNYVITGILEDLQILGILKYELKNGREGNRHFYLISGVEQEYYF